MEKHTRMKKKCVADTLSKKRSNENHFFEEVARTINTIFSTKLHTEFEARYFGPT